MVLICAALSPNPATQHLFCLCSVADSNIYRDLGWCPQSISPLLCRWTSATGAPQPHLHRLQHHRRQKWTTANGQFECLLLQGYKASSIFTLKDHESLWRGSNSTSIYLIVQRWAPLATPCQYDPEFKANWNVWAKNFSCWLDSYWGWKPETTLELHRALEYCDFKGYDTKLKIKV